MLDGLVVGRRADAKCADFVDGDAAVEGDAKPADEKPKEDGAAKA